MSRHRRLPLWEAEMCGCGVGGGDRVEGHDEDGNPFLTREQAERWADSMERLTDSLLYEIRPVTP